MRCSKSAVAEISVQSAIYFPLWWLITVDRRQHPPGEDVCSVLPHPRVQGDWQRAAYIHTSYGGLIT